MAYTLLAYPPMAADHQTSTVQGTPGVSPIRPVSHCPSSLAPQ